MNKLGQILKEEYVYIFILVAILAINVPVLITPTSTTKQGDVAAEFSQVASAPEEFAGSESKLKEKMIKDYLASHPEDERKIAFLFLIILLALVLGIGMNIRYFLKGQKPFYPSDDDAKNLFQGKWAISDVFRVIILLGGFGYVVSYSTYSLKNIVPIFATMNARTLSGSTIIDIGSIAAVIWYVRHRYGQGPVYLGLSLKEPRKTILEAFAGYVAMLPWLALVLLVISVAISLTGFEPKPQAVYDLFMEEENPMILAYTTFFAAVAGPVFEEIFFRGFFFGALRRRFSFLRAAAISGFFFSFLHFTPVGFIPIMLLGMLFCYLYEKSDSLLAPISVHIIHNATMIYGVFFLKRVFSSM